jgi:hypothetical protein
MNAAKYRNYLALFLIILVLTTLSFASLAIRNYDQDPDLAAALEYDRGETTDRSKPEHDHGRTTDGSKADRELAEKYYLEYLKKDIPSFQKARVYLRLGALYTVESDPGNGIMPDREKGVGYLERVLQLEPQRIDVATIRARTLLASATSLSSEESLRRRLDVYEWLSSLDEEKFRKLWLPLEPEQKAILPITLKYLQSYVPNVKRTTAVNAVALAAHMPDGEARLAEIIGRFPDTEIADMARRELKRLLEQVGEETFNDVTSVSGAGRNAPPGEDAGLPLNLESQADGITREASMPPQKPSAQRSDAVPALADTRPVEGGTHTAWIVYSLIGCAALTGSSLLYVAWRRRHFAGRPES